MTTYDADAFNAFEAGAWDRKAGAYDRIWARVTARVADPLLDAAGVGPGVRVLDVGTGPGDLAARAADRGAVALGIDAAAGMLALAARKHPGVEFRAGNAEELWCADALFDAVLASFVLLHVGRQDRALAEFARVLVPSGCVALTLWSPESVVHAVFLESMAEVDVQLPPGLAAGPPIVRPDDEVVDLVRNAGFVDVRLEHVRLTERFHSAEAMAQRCSTPLCGCRRSLTRSRRTYAAGSTPPSTGGWPHTPSPTASSSRSWCSWWSPPSRDREWCFLCHVAACRDCRL